MPLFPLSPYIHCMLLPTPLGEVTGDTAGWGQCVADSLCWPLTLTAPLTFMGSPWAAVPWGSSSAWRDTSQVSVSSLVPHSVPCHVSPRVSSPSLIVTAVSTAVPTRQKDLTGSGCSRRALTPCGASHPKGCTRGALAAQHPLLRYRPGTWASGCKQNSTQEEKKWAFNFSSKWRKK